ncbi:MAG: 50S ribosomal protein L3 [Candidatus Bathyarchaeota archaeon]|nr:MAG: 50S ribosomal protein L3 [Candidatus Bathyarchaeota archaeon]
MGHRKKHAPRRGSLAYLPRGRATSETGRIRYWPKVEEGPALLGFMGYKAGMTHVFLVEDDERSPNFGKETSHPATVVDTPPIILFAIRAYTRDPYGLHTLTEAWMKNPPRQLDRIVTLPESLDPIHALKKMEENLARISEFRLMAATQPKEAGVPKKKPEIIETKIDGGTIEEQFEHSKNLLGKTISITEVFKEGQYVDAVAVTKGKGFQGPVKRWGIKILPRKSRKTKRGVAVIGPWHPTRVLYTVPRAGQMGYHQRTEYNKRILKIGTDGSEITPKGGFLRYGPVRGTYMLLDGSLPGPVKRLVRLRYPARPPKTTAEAPPRITHISLESPQG